jgi:hypothetical protein
VVKPFDIIANVELTRQHFPMNNAMTGFGIHDMNAYGLLSRFLFLLCLLSAGLAHAADRRVALVMGNGAYAGSAKLRNAVADAKLMARTLEGLGFKVTLLTDVQTEQDMKRALVQFKRSLPDAEVGLVYFSGHGVQTERGNYLLPVQGDYQREADFDSQAVRLSDVLEQFRGSRAAGLVILDACRDNPFRSSTRSATRGLRREEPPNGLLIAYSTAQNQTAADGVGGNGLYTKHLAHFLSQKGLSVDEVFDQTAKQVKLESRGEQSPREDSDIRDKLYLNGAPQSAGAPGAAPAPGDDLEAQAWKDAQLLDTPAGYETFSTAYPNSRYAGAARLKLDIARKREQQQAEAAQARSTGGGNEGASAERSEGLAGSAGGRHGGGLPRLHRQLCAEPESEGGTAQACSGGEGRSGGTGEAGSGGLAHGAAGRHGRRVRSVPECAHQQQLRCAGSTEA